MRRFVLSMALVCVQVAAAHAQMPSPDPRVETLIEKNSLQRAGLKPWHLRMSFTVFDLRGSKKEDGTLEIWWAAPGQQRTVIQSPSYSQTTPGEDNPAGSLRTSTLVNDLISQVVNPVQLPLSGTFKEETHTVGPIKLTCLSVEGMTAVSGSDAAGMAEICSNPASSAVRASIGQNMSAARNRMATFQGVMVALDASITLEEKTAISGHVEELKTFDVAASGLTFTEPRKAQETPQRIPAAVLAGKLVNKTQPEYPPMARAQRAQGAVMLCGVIQKDGTMGKLEVLASPNSSLSEAAMDAVKRWKYQPYLLNGEPVEVDTTIVVNFSLNGGGVTR